jgi:threonine dehydrogenase-like Zn-dependent dehydrogenase
MALGHEPVAVVTATGEGVTNVKPGDRVVLDTMLACGRCRFCLDGHSELCTHSNEIGFSVDGNYGDRAILPAANLHLLPPTVDDLQGTMIEALTCQLGAVEALNVGFGESAAIIGSGLAALTFVQLLRNKGAGWVGMNMRSYPERVRLAQEFGADEVVVGEAAALRKRAVIQSSDGYDIVIDAVGTEPAALTALSLARRGGKVLLYGLSSAVINNFPLGEMIFHNLTLFGKTSAPKMWEPAISLMGRGAVRLQAMIGEVVAIEDLPRLLTTKESGGPIKRVVRTRE